MIKVLLLLLAVLYVVLSKRGEKLEREEKISPAIEREGRKGKTRGVEEEVSKSRFLGREIFNLAS